MAMRDYVIQAVTTISGRHDQVGLYGGPAGDLGLCGGPASVSWEINGDLGSVATAGVAAIVLEVLHPSVVAGVQDHSDYQRDPFRRARTTMGYVLGTTFGNTEAATKLIEGVRNRHTAVTGTRPDGRSYQALDPTLIAWVHTCIPWMVMTAFERFNRPLLPSERDRYLAEQAAIGRMGGADDVPASMAELSDFVAQVRPELAVTEQTRAFIDFLLGAPFAPSLPAPLRAGALQYHRFSVRAGMSLAPRWARKLTGLELPNAVRHHAAEPHARASAQLIRWAFGVPPYVALARERVGGRPPADASAGQHPRSGVADPPAAHTGAPA